MAQDQFLTVASNILYKTMVDSSRTLAKNTYKAMLEGKRVALITVRMDDDSEVRFDISLDSSEFRGKLNFGAFRASVTQLVRSLGEQIKQEREAPVFSDEEEGSVLFGVPGITQEDQNVNVIMMAADTRTSGTVLLKLMYMDPDQFQQQQTSSRS